VKIEKNSKPLPTTTHSSDASSRLGAGKAAAKPGVSAGAGSADETSVHLGSTSAQLRSIESGVANTPVVDAKKVAEIKQAISEGRFQVNSDVVADHLINTAQDLITASNH
jgi:negative regulator of flagellin synthesis FlgM